MSETKLILMLSFVLEMSLSLVFGQEPAACPNLRNVWNRTYIVNKYYNGSDALYSRQNVIFFDYKNISNFNSDSFVNLTNLTDLDLGQNNMTCLLDENLFKSLINLELLGIQDNQLRSLNVNLFSTLTKLKSLYLGGNMFNETTFNENQFKGLTKLEGVYLGANKFTSLPANLFNNLTALATLDLGGNELTSLDQNVFKGLKSLKSIKNKYNKV